MKLGVCKNLCADLVLGQDFMKRYRRVVFELNEKGKNVVISRSVCGVPATNIPPMRLFKNLDPGVKPIATKLKRFNLENQKFIRSEIKKLLNESIIEPPRLHGGLKFWLLTTADTRKEWSLITAK